MPLLFKTHGYKPAFWLVSFQLIVVSILAILGTVAPVWAQTCANPSPTQGYALPCPIFSISSTSLTQAQSLTLSATPQVGTDYIYTTAYIYDGAWKPYTLSGNNAYPSYSSALSTLNLSLSNLSLGTHYAVVWDWLWDANAGCYKGPGLNQCNTGQWRVQTFTVMTAPSPTPLSITTTYLPSGTVGTGYTANLIASGGTAPYTWSAASGQLPTGLTVSANGVISGTPTTGGNYSFSVMVTDTGSPQQTNSQTLSISITPSLNSPSSTCGPPNYGALSTSSITPAGIGYAAGATTPPAVDSYFYDTGFGNELRTTCSPNGTKIYRVTGPNTLPTVYPNHAYSMSGGWMSNAWASDSNHHYIMTDNGWTLFFAFDQTKFAAGQAGADTAMPCSFSATGNVSCFDSKLAISITSPQWSRSTSGNEVNKIYGISPGGANQYKLIYYDLTGYSSSVAPTENLLYNPFQTSCLNTTPFVTDSVSTSMDMNRIAMFGNGSIVIVYDKAQNKCRWFDTNGGGSGMVGGDATGATGVPVWQNAAGSTYAYTYNSNYDIHTLHISKDGNWVWISNVNSSYTMYWQVDTKNVAFVAGQEQNGHNATGFSQVAVPGNSSIGGGQYAATYNLVWPAAYVEGTNQINKFRWTLIPGGDWHYTWNNNRAGTNAEPLLMSRYESRTFFATQSVTISNTTKQVTCSSCFVPSFYTLPKEYIKFTGGSNAGTWFRIASVTDASTITLDSSYTLTSETASISGEWRGQPSSPASPIAPNDPVAYMGEIVGVEMDLTYPTQKVWRFGHSFSDFNDTAGYPIQVLVSASQDGKYILFSSNWFGQLLNTSGGACTVSSTCRYDTFIMALK